MSAAQRQRARHVIDDWSAGQQRFIDVDKK